MMMNTTIPMLRRILLHLALVAGLSLPMSGIAQDWQWALREGGINAEGAKKVAVDASGNSFVVSTFTGTFTIGGNTYTSANYDLILAKYDLSGKLLWSKQIGSSLNDEVSAITLDRSGGVLISGTFAGVNLNYDGALAIANSNAGFTDAYLLRVNGSGGLAWAYHPIGLGNDQGGGVCTDGTTILLAGNVLSLSIQFDPAIAAVANPSSESAFICSLDMTGKVNKGRMFGGNYKDFGVAVALDAAGNAYLGGMFSSTTLKFDGITLTNALFSTTDIFVTKFLPDLTAVWATSASGSGDDLLTAMAVDGANNIYFTGSFKSPTLTMGGKSRTNALGADEMLVGSLTTGGVANWLTGPSADVQSKGSDISVSGTEIYVAGYYKGGTLSLNTALANAGLSDGFIAQLNAAGSFIWNDRFGGAADDAAYGVAATGCGAVVAGDFNSATVVLPSNTLTNAMSGQSDMLVARVARKISFNMPHTKNLCGNTAPLDAGAGYSAYQWVTGENTQTINVTASGMYAVRVLDASGCYGTDSTRVSIVNADVLNPDATVCKGTPIKLWVDSSAQGGVLVRSFSHAMNQVWTESFSTINQGYYRLVVTGTWQSISMVGFRLDAANQYVLSTGAFNRKWSYPADNPAPFRVNGNALRPVNDVYQSGHSYEYRFQATSPQTIIDFTEAYLADNDGTLNFDLYRINDPSTVTWSTGDLTNLINVSPTTTTTYVATMTDGTTTCSDKVVITVPTDLAIALSSAAATESQAICVNSNLTPITYTTAGATSASIVGLPTGVTYALVGSVLTISGVPTVDGVFNYVITITGNCGSTTHNGKISTFLNNQITLTSVAGTDNQSLCVNSPVTPITYSTTLATGATFTGLPAGVTGGWAAGVVTIQGSPTKAGKFDYVITLTGGCGTVTQNGTINVNADNTLKLSSAVGTDAQVICVNSAILPITYATTGATGGVVTGLPTGLSGTWAANVLTISGTTSQTGTFDYAVSLSGGCGGIMAWGKIIVTPLNTITLSSAPGTDAQLICVNTPLTAIRYATTGATGATIAGLPAGVTYSWAANVLTISGIPTVPGGFPYTITLTGGCGSITMNGGMAVQPNNTIVLSSAVGTDAQSVCVNSAATDITYTTTGATGATVTDLPTGLSYAFSGNTLTITGTPTVKGTFQYHITLSGGCGIITQTGTVTVNQNTISLSSAAATESQTVCLNSTLTPINYTTTGATGASFTNLPAGVSGVWSGNAITITGAPVVTGTFNYTVTLTGGCDVITRSGTIKVTTPDPASVTIATAITTVCSGTPVTFLANPVNAGNAPLFQWQVNFKNVAGSGTSFTSNSLGDGDQVCVIMTSNAACVSGSPAESNIVRMQVNPIPSLTSTTPASACGPSAVTLNAIPSSGSVNWYATATGAGTLFTGQTFITPVIGTTTTYFAEASSLGCVSPTRIPIVATINTIPAPTVMAGAGPEICISNDVNYSTQSGMSTYAWTIGGVYGTDYSIKAGGLGATDNSVTLSWLTAGNHSVQVNYTDAKGCAGTAAKADLHVNALPTGTLSAPADLTLCKGDGVQLNATGGSSYAWYRNGQVDPLFTSANYPAKQDGVYTAQIISAAGCKAMATGNATVSFKPVPVPQFDVLPACAGSATQFVNGTTYGGAGSLQFSWNLDDGASATTTDATHIYVQGGNKRVTLTAISSTCPNAPEVTTALVPITSSRPAVHIGPVDAEAGQPVGLQARTFGQTYSWAPSAGLSDPTSDHPEANLNKDASFTVAITDIGGCVTVDTVSVRVFPGQRIYVPTAFTPNGDGLNDRLHPVIVGFKELSFFRIYNRFGNLVHETNNTDAAHGWDGRFRGYEQQTGTYTWALRAIDKSGTEVNKTGTFTLIR